MNKVFNVLRLQLAVTFAYRGTILFWLLIHMIGFIVMYAFWTAVFSDRESFNGFMLTSMLQYILFANIIREFVLVAPEYEINNDIRSGKLSSYLLRPFSYPLHIILSSSLWHLVEIFFALLLYGLVGYLILGNSIWISEPQLLLYILPLLFIGHIFCSLLSLILGSLAFWLTEASAFFYYKDILILLSAGLFFPRATTPLWFQQIMDVLPFYSCIGLPAEILVHKSTIETLLPALAHVSLWTLLLLIIAYPVWKHGIKKYEAVGN
ncbi:MAG: ABC-2 family transporter protein [Candidatus Abawacabacteria bacterium]|nr:ABC-2 family transporter protein [Candidatus Abawacabacteria bacterium]